MFNIIYCHSSWDVYEIINNKDIIYVFYDSVDQTRNTHLDPYKSYDNTIGVPTRKCFAGNDRFYTNNDFGNTKKMVDEYIDKIFYKFLSGNYKRICVRDECIDPDIWRHSNELGNYIRDSLQKLDTRLSDNIFMTMFRKIEQLESMITDKNKQIDNLLSRIDAVETIIDYLYYDCCNKLK